jgi:hypothetical protein
LKEELYPPKALPKRALIFVLILEAIILPNAI